MTIGRIGPNIGPKLGKTWGYGLTQDVCAVQETAENPDPSVRLDTLPNNAARCPRPGRFYFAISTEKNSAAASPS